jgi:hypothetical protein
MSHFQLLGRTLEGSIGDSAHELDNGPKEAKEATLGESNIQSPLTGVEHSHQELEKVRFCAKGDFAHGAGGTVLFVRFDMSNLSTVCTFALSSLWLRFAATGVIRAHVSIRRRWSDDTLGFLTGEPTVFVLLQACKLVFEARERIVSIFANKRKGKGGG